MEVEVVGGRWDGTHLLLEVVQDDADTIRVLEAAFKTGRLVSRASAERAVWDEGEEGSGA